VRRALAAFTRGGARGIIVQLAVVVGVLLVLGTLVANVAANLQRLGVKTGFGFLARPAGFDISQVLFAYDESATYLAAFVAALANTLLVTAIAGVLATILGFLIAIARSSSNGLVAGAAAGYVEAFRNVPLLLQLLFWYFAILQPLPGPKESLNLGEIVFLNNRGLFIPSLHFGDGVMWSIPSLQGFNFKGGIAIQPELFALALGLTLYSAAFIAEIVRGGVQAVPAGQLDAARSLGLTRWQCTRFIVIPLALRVIVPPLGAYYVLLLKNTSLGSAIAYPDLMHVFAGTVLNQTGQPIEVMGITLATYLLLGLSLSFATSAVNRWVLR
jgi:general L-amino acid transport system permease protein